MTKNTMQLRGHCQCCGNIQAVKNGYMSYHGYTVQNHWFQGVCSGHSYGPMERDTSVSRKIVVDVRHEADELMERADALENGRAVLGMVRDPRARTPRKGEPEVKVNWVELPDYYRSQVLQSAVWNMRGRAKSGYEFANILLTLADAWQGKELLKVERTEGPAPIKIGERRIMEDGKPARVTRINKARVYWETECPRRFQSWTGSTAWRKLPLA